jgi:sugar phosphate permease
MISMLFTHAYLWGLFVMLLVGLSLGTITPATSTAVVLWFRAKERATAMGLKQTALNCGGMLTAATLPALAIAYGWRIGFVLLGITAILFGIGSFVLYRDPPKDEAQAASAILPVTTKARGEPEIVCDPAAPVLRKESSLAALRSRDLWFTTIAAMALGANEFMIFTYYVLYLKEHMLVPVVSAGFILGAVDLGGLFGKPVSGIISDRLFGGRRKETFILLAATATILTVVIALLPVGTPQWVLVVCSAVFGFAAVAWAGVFYTIAGEFGGREHCGIVTGFAVGMISLSVTFGVPLFGYLADKMHTWTWSWVYAAATAAIGTFILFFVREERKKLQA